VLRDVLARAALAAHTDSPVMVIGETGTGKELLVQAIHNGSIRCSRPFIAQNCAALPEGLLEVILFGSVKGSFTGAQDRPGLFELASGGTLFLDELNAMPRQLQAKLLRVLETGELRRLGDVRSRRIDVRIIVAMAVDPKKELRADLYYRLNVVTLNLPPLRARKGDIPLLCSHFLDRHNAKLATRVKGISKDVAMKLTAWPWPGNIRELSNLLEGILNFRGTGIISSSDLPDYFQKTGSEKSLRRELKLLERNMIFDAMDITGGNISSAAHILDIPRQTLQRKLSKLQWHETCN